MAKEKIIRVGTRESQLARLQTDIAVAALIKQFPDAKFEIVPITTHGDKVQDKPIAELGARGVFVKELEKALFAREVDFVVHSLKDLPTDMPDGLFLGAVLERDDPRDVLVSKGNITLNQLAPGSLVATSSRRRVAQLKAMRNDLKFTDIRGNIQTRFRKHDEGQCDAMILAAAGLLRLGLGDRICEFLPVDLFTPAVGQGALAVECLSSDKATVALLTAVDDQNVRAQSNAERSFLDRLGGGCSVPIGGFAESIGADRLKLSGCVASLDGSRILRASAEGDASDALELGCRLAEKICAMGAEDILGELRQSQPNTISAP